MNLPTESHPFPAYYPKTCSYLLVGSFPPIKLTNKITDNISTLEVKYLFDNYLKNTRNSITKDDILFYYGSRDNLLWQKIIAPIFGAQLNSKKDIIAFLDKYNIGITDVCEEVSRNIIDGKINSEDTHLNIHKCRDIAYLIKEKKIKIIFSTSIWVTDKIISQLLESRLKAETVEIITLPSPSKIASRTIGRKPEYKLMKNSKLIENTIQYRQLKYIQLFKDKISHQ